MSKSQITESSQLIFHIQTVSTGVPDTGSSGLLLGLALAGCALARSRKIRGA
jgi:hypothetical protein